jgi:hypothetical protein
MLMRLVGDLRSPSGDCVRVRAGGLTAALFASLALFACGSATRSAGAVCHVWDTEGLALHDKFEADAQREHTSGTEGLLAGLISIIGGPNELSRLMSQMAAVAPETAAPDFETVADSFKKVSDSEGKALTNPLAAIGANLVTAISSSGSFKRVNEFLTSNCGIPHH